MRFGVLTRWYVYGPIAAALLAFVIWRARPADIVELLATADWRPIVFALTLNFVVIALWVVRSRALLAGHGHAIGAWPMALLVTFASTASSLTPASAGEALRAVLLQRRHAVPLATGTAVIVIERVMALYLLAITTAVAWVWLVLDPDAIGDALLLAAAIALAAAPILAYRAGFRPVGRLGRTIARRYPRGRAAALGAGLMAVDDRIGGTAADIRALVVFAIATGGVFLVFATQFALVGLAIGTPIDLATAWAVMGISVIVGVLSAIPFGLGPADAAIAILLPLLGVPPSTAAVMAILYRFVSTLPIAILGVGAYLLLSRTPAERTSGPAAERG